jgi:hypothetical protein
MYQKIYQQTWNSQANYQHTAVFRWFDKEPIFDDEENKFFFNTHEQKNNKTIDFFNDLKNPKNNYLSSITVNHDQFYGFAHTWAINIPYFEYIYHSYYITDYQFKT